MKTFARQVAHNFKPDPFVRAGHERDALLHFHEEISLRNTGKQERRSGLIPAEDSEGSRAGSGRYSRDF
jgi:hypothetical protein